MTIHRHCSFRSNPQLKISALPLTLTFKCFLVIEEKTRGEYGLLTLRVTLQNLPNLFYRFHFSIINIKCDQV